MFDQNSKLYIAKKYEINSLFNHTGIGAFVLLPNNKKYNNFCSHEPR